MITEIRIENFKSIASLTLQPGRVTVLIGENGSGKSNILEAIAFGAGAAGNKLDREFLYSRGIRVTDYDWMRSAFYRDEGNPWSDIRLWFDCLSSEKPLNYLISPYLRPDDNSFLRWTVKIPAHESKISQKVDLSKISNLKVDVRPDLQPSFPDSQQEEFKREAKEQDNIDADKLKNIIDDVVAELVAEFKADQGIRSSMAVKAEQSGLMQFLIYAPENTVLRKFDPEDAIEPLGSQGQGLLKLLQSFNNEQYRDRFTELKELLHTLGWFGDLSLPTPDDAMRDRIRIQDALLPPDKSFFDQRSANEGFLLLLFYFVLFLSWRTPKFFAIDNIDTALNPKLCATLMRQLAALAAKYDKQVIFTTHNPAVLDGLDLTDDEQRLFVVSRNDEGETKVRRVSAPQPRPGERPIKLSEAFLRGLIGGLPKNF